MKEFIPALLLLVFTAGRSYGADEQYFDKSLSVSGPVDIEVTTNAGGITIRHGSPGIVKIHAFLKANEGWFRSSDAEARIQRLIKNPPVDQTGNHIRVGYVRERELARDISIRFEIETPPNTEVRARADSGGIRVEGVRGPVDCKTDSGGIYVRDIAAAVRAEGDSGGIRIRDVKGSLYAHVDSGGIEALDIAGSIDAKTDSGSITLSQTTPASVRARAESGGIRLTLARGAGYDLDVQTGSGRISTPELTSQRNSSHHHTEGQVRGGGALVRINAESGGVVID